ncbi:MAG: hypothetical protein JXR84_23950 [Anaerolineae bacterium]|nr:hypothetical protein [Anaerolineae bacterium]
MMWRCPICGSTNLEQTRSIDGEMFCLDCGFRVEDKSVVPNPFFVKDAVRSEPAEPTHPPLGEQMAVLYKSKSDKSKK